MSHRIARLLIANRGEIAIRIARAAAELGIETLAVYTADDADSLHRYSADDCVELSGRAADGYMDQQQLIRLAQHKHCDAIHPGYGFLSENPGFARRCEQAGLTFAGPRSEVLEVFGDKALSRELAQRCEVPLVPGTGLLRSVDAAQAFMGSLSEERPIMIKAIAGGGGRGMRPVYSLSALPEAFQHARAEASAAFGNDAVYAEELLTDARHIEIQILGDGTGAVTHLWERDCSLQRQRQKLIEIAPAPVLSEDVRWHMIEAALTMAREVRYRGVGTFEFLVDARNPERFFFMECNPRIQVEHTITEEITGVDLVAVQLELAAGATLAGLGLAEPPLPQGFAIQTRVYLESLDPQGRALPASGVIREWEPPTGPGLRIDHAGYAGYRVPVDYDTLIAKVISRGRSFEAATKRNYRALCEFRITGVNHNLTVLLNGLHLCLDQQPPFSTTFIEQNLSDLLGTQQQQPHPQFHPETSGTEQAHDTPEATPEGLVGAHAPCSGRVLSLAVSPGESVVKGQALAVLEAMKMEFIVEAPQSGILREFRVEPEQAVYEGMPLALLEPAEVAEQEPETEAAMDLEAIRQDLDEVLQRHGQTRDEQRPEAVERRHAKGKQTARENLDQLLDEGSFQEYGALALAAQRRRRTTEDLIQRSPADGLIAGTGTVNAEAYGDQAARCLALAYDYTVFAGTQGVMNHKKTDRMLRLAGEWKLPVVLMAEGGGGRPGDSDYLGVSGLDVPTFAAMARLSGQVPLISVVSGRCFAVNAALAGCCDVIIGTRDTTLGMAGPAMIEGGGLGRFRPEEVGPVSVQAPNGVLDIVADNEAEAVECARQYLGYFQGELRDWDCEDQRVLRHRIPENRVRVYDIHRVIEDLADTGSVLELRSAFAKPMITALIRIQGKPFGLIANNPAHLGGAINASAADKAARFMQLCDAFGLPMVSLCDTPGFMVGPEAEKEATVRHVSRMFVTAASLCVPFFTLVLRKGYGLGAQAMAAGSFHAPFFTAAWPTGEFGAMGLEGAVRLGYAEELNAVEDPVQRQELFDTMVSRAYEQGKAINTASFLEIDAVIDPAETRNWILRGLNSAGGAPQGRGQRPFVDTW